VKSSQKHWGIAIPPKPLETLFIQAGSGGLKNNKKEKN